jgi:hypothetical protein
MRQFLQNHGEALTLLALAAIVQLPDEPPASWRALPRWLYGWAAHSFKTFVSFRAPASRQEKEIIMAKKHTHFSERVALGHSRHASAPVDPGKACAAPMGQASNEGPGTPMTPGMAAPAPPMEPDADGDQQ